MLASAVIRLSRHVNEEAAVERYLAPMNNQAPTMNPFVSPAGRQYVVTLHGFVQGHYTEAELAAVLPPDLLAHLKDVTQPTSG